MHQKNQTGFGMIEMIIGATILSVSLLAISSFFQSALRISETTKVGIQSGFLLEEGIEGVKFLRDTNYTNNLKNLATSTDKYLVWSGTTWATTTVNTLIDGRFERKFTVADVVRDENDDIALSGTWDPNTKLVTVFVSWNDRGATTTRSIATYISNLFDN